MDKLEKIKKKKLKELMESKKIQTEIKVSDENFQEKVIEQSKRIPIVVDFWASWCMPCMILGPVLEKVSRNYKGKFILAKANVNENPVSSKKYGIMSIPAVKLFKHGKVLDEFIGALPEQAIIQWLNKNLSD